MLGSIVIRTASSVTFLSLQEVLIQQNSSDANSPQGKLHWLRTHFPNVLLFNRSYFRTEENAYSCLNLFLHSIVSSLVLVSEITRYIPVHSRKCEIIVLSKLWWHYTLTRLHKLHFLQKRKSQIKNNLKYKFTKR